MKEEPARMDFELSARYRVTGNFVGLPAFGPFDMTYLGERARGEPTSTYLLRQTTGSSWVYPITWSVSDFWSNRVDNPPNGWSFLQWFDESSGDPGCAFLTGAMAPPCTFATWQATH